MNNSRRDQLADEYVQGVLRDNPSGFTVAPYVNAGAISIAYEAGWDAAIEEMNPIYNAGYDAAMAEKLSEWQSIQEAGLYDPDVANKKPTIFVKVEKEKLEALALEVKQLCDLICCSPPTTPIKGKIESLALQLGHHPDILNAKAYEEK